MKNNVTKVLLPLVFWSLIWFLASRSLNNTFLLPSIRETFVALAELLKSRNFYYVVLLSFLRVLTGLFLGSAVGIVLAISCSKINVLNDVVSPFITVVKATPVASFIVLLWALMNGDMISIFVGFLMVLPIIWQSTKDAISSTDRELSEVAEVFQFSVKKRFQLLLLPSLKRFLPPAIITATGLAWKAEIAAEIIAYTKKSIGQGINDAKYNLNTPEVFAWTLVVIIFSISLECVAKKMLRSMKWH